MEDVVRLPLQGPLNITDFNNFLDKSREEIKALWDAKFKNRDFVLKDFEVEKLLGSGTFGKVYLVQNQKNKNLYAMKTISKQSILKLKLTQSVRNEINVLKCVNFPFTVYLEFLYLSTENVYLIEPFIDCGELFTHLHDIGHFNEKQSMFYCAQIILAFEYLHYSNIIYRDLKPENVLIDHTGYIKLTDFGFSKIVENRTYTLCGTPEYLAPEVILNTGYNKAADWWALGVFLYEIASGFTPFASRDPMQMHSKTVMGKYKMPEDFSRQLKDLIHNLLQVDITKRFGNLKDGVKDVKGHVWFQNLNWMSVLNRLMVSPFIPRIKPLNFRKGLSRTSLALKYGKSFDREFGGF